MSVVVSLGFLALACGLFLPSEAIGQAGPSRPGQRGTPAAGGREIDVSSEPASLPRDSLVVYELGEGDRLSVEVYNKLNEKEYSTEVDVDGLGEIVLPLINRVKVKGLTLNDVKTVLEKKYADVMVEPVVNVVIQEKKSKTISVLGAVRGPAQFNIQRNSIKLLEAITLAGGTNETASTMVRILRAGGEELLIDLLEILEKGRSDLNVDLYPGDTVIVLENRKKIYVMGWVNNPNEFGWEPGLTVLAAIGKAGGFREEAAKGRTTVRRTLENGKVKKVKVNPEERKMLVEPGDVINVPGKIF